MTDHTVDPSHKALSPTGLCLFLLTFLGHAGVAAQAVRRMPLTMPLPPGEHPRILFTKADLPRLRNWALAPQQKEFLQGLRWIAHDYHGLRKGLESNDPTWMADQRRQARLLECHLQTDAANAAFLYQLTRDEKDGRIAAAAFRIWLSAYPPTPELEPRESRGSLEWALAYDWIHALLSPAERRRAVAVFASLLSKPTLGAAHNRWHTFGHSANCRMTSNKSMLWACRIGITCLAIEGLPEGNPELVGLACEAFQRTLDNGISPEGALYEGTQYALGYGTKHVPLFLMALRLRKVPASRFPHLRKVESWLCHEMQPWGYEGFAYNQSAGQFGAASRLMYYLTAEGLSGPIGFPGQWHDSMLACFYGDRRRPAGSPDGLPLSKWFGARGLVFCRSDWSHQGTLFFLNTNRLGAGHSHEDQGSFCLASHGAVLVSDSGLHEFKSQRHNVILIDGLGQGPGQGRTEAYIRCVESNRYGDIIDVDLKRAYSLTLSGRGEGPFHWDDFNPVGRADRRVLFVRGLTGPLVVLADDIKKDTVVRTYDWLLHTGINNILTIDGNRFSIRERFGGRYFHATKRSHLTTLVPGKMPKGPYGGWALVRSNPSQSQWCKNHVKIGTRTVAIPFGNGYFSSGWRWVPIAKGEVMTGETPVRLRSTTGGRVACLVFTRDPHWQPIDWIPQPADKVVLLGPDNALKTDANPWQIARSNRAILEGLFLGPNTPRLSAGTDTNLYGRSRGPQNRALHAVLKGVGARYACLLVPREEGDQRAVRTVDGTTRRCVRMDCREGTDFVAVRTHNTGLAQDVVTDGIGIISVGKASSAQSVRSYALMNGRRLVYRGRALVDAKQPLHVLNDGHTLVVRGPGGTEGRFARLTSHALERNGLSSRVASDPELVVKIPVLPDKWSVHVSPEGRTVRVTGNGLRPLVINNAPHACEVLVNGVSRYFVRKGVDGPIHVSLEDGTGLHRYRGMYAAAELKECLDRDAAGRLTTADTLDPILRREPVLRSHDRALRLRLPIPGPGVYDVHLQYIRPGTGQVKVVMDGEPLPGCPRPAPGRYGRAMWGKRRVMTTGVVLEMRAPADFAVRMMRIVPVYRPIEATQWHVIGPFPSDYLMPGVGFDTAAVRRAMQTVHPPETAVDLGKQYRGARGQVLAWTRCTRASDPYTVDFTKVLPIKNSKVCYAATFITSPERREAEIQLSCDYWANVFVNGTRLTSDRARPAAAADASEFNSPSPYRARMKLAKGVNCVLVKCHGGSGGNSFRAAITDPGDLKVSLKP